MTVLYPFLLAGGLAGLISALAYSVLWSAIELWRPQLADTWSGGRALSTTGILVHFIGGTLLGLLFWLSWGLAAVVDVQWWQRGLIFGAVVWSSLSAPGVLTASLARDVPLSSALSLLLQWFCTCVLAGMACAWSWEAAMTA